MINNGIVLSGGAARGLAHIGALKALDEAGIKPDFLAGTSMGAIVASMRAVGMSPQEIDDEIKKKPVWSMIDFSVAKAGIMSGNKIVTELKKYLGEISFKELKIPLRVCVVDIEKGNTFFLKEGKVIDAVRASISIPGIFLPKYYKGKMLVDGGLINNLPLDALDDIKCQHKIGISVRRIKNHKLLYRDYLKTDKKIWNNIKYPRHKLMFDVLKRSYNIIMGEHELRSIKLHPDYKIMTIKMPQYDYSDFFKKNEIIDEGYKEGKEWVKTIIN